MRNGSGILFLDGARIMRLSCKETAHIAEMLGQMLRAGLSLDRIFEVIGRHRSRRGAEAVEAVRLAVQSGRSFYEGFNARSDLWPRYFIELIRCSEIAGLLYAGFEEGADHFRKIARMAHAVNMLWLSPLIILSFGWVVNFSLILWFEGRDEALAYLAVTAVGLLPPLAIILAFLLIPPLRQVLDRLLLVIPFAAETVLQLSVYQFTTCFRYLYIGAVSAQEIVRLAAGAVSNSYVRGRVAVAAEPVAKGQSFAEALVHRIHWPPDYIETIANAETSGQLESVLNTLAEEQQFALELRVRTIRNIVERILFYVVVGSIVATILGISTTARGL